MSKNVIFLTISVLLTTLPVSHSLFGISFDDVKTVVSWGYDVYGKVNEAYDLYGTYTADASLDTIVDGIRDISEKLDQVSNKLSMKISTLMETLMRRLPLIQRRDDGLRRLASYLGTVDRLYKNFERYTAEGVTVDPSTLKSFARTVTSSKTGDLPDVLFKMQRLIIPEYGNIAAGLFELISQETQESLLDLCNTVVSPQQRIYQLYNTIMIAEMKAHVITSFAYTILRVTESGSFESELRIAADDFAEKAKAYLRVTYKAMLDAPRSVRRCEPKHHVRGKTFVEMERFMQLYIVNEVDLSRTGSCDATCTSMPRSARQTSCYDSNYCHPKFCRGTLVDCHWAGGPMSACQLPTQNVRRYVFFEDFHGMNGPGPDCPAHLGAVWTHFYGWTRFTFNCDYCLCTCLEDTPESTAIRTLSFRNQLSDIKNNMVVIGIRFELSGDMVNTIILQGRIMPQGRVDQEDQSWVPIDSTAFQPEATKRERWGVFHQYYEDDKGENVTFKMRFGRDFGMLSEKQRDIHLDDIMLPDDYVVTGARFKHPADLQKPWDYSPFRFEVHGTPFDFETGKLVPSDEKPSRWFSADTMTNRPDKYYGRKRKEVLLTNPGDPLVRAANLPDSEPNSFIRFRESDRRADAGQSTVPFFDAQQVGGRAAFPLNGIGLFHKGYESSGGFLAFRIFSIDLTKFIKMPEDDEAPDYKDYDYR